MLSKLIIVICVIQTCLSTCNDCSGYSRFKRSKYYSNPPPRFYRKPPMSYPVQGPFSYTPPPGYMDDGHRSPGPHGPPGPSGLAGFQGPAGPPPSYKVSKHKEGLGEEDFSNLIKYLSKQDLDRIVELAAEKDRHTNHFKTPYEERDMFKIEPDFDTSKIVPFGNDDQKPNFPYSSENFVEIRPSLDGSQKPLNNNVNPYLDSEESRDSQQIFDLNSYIHKELDKNFHSNSKDVIFTDSETMKEESLPKPQNLRDDYEVSHTNNIPTVVRANSYKLENFADLPLMNYDHSKLETVNSYSVPHYTVTAQRNPVPPPQSLPKPNKPLATAAQQQSDAHLKAVKIWTHKSTGTAYTLHDDGTLSLEKPLRPKHKF